jgi:hypothetical protein
VISACALPAGALLDRYRGDGGFADCYATELPCAVSHAEFVEAFYTTALFKLERLVLRVFFGRPSSDLEAAGLARGELDAFAAWSVEGRGPDQLLLADLAGRTRSWLMVAPAAGGGTRLYFGSAVLARRSPGSGRARMGGSFHALLGFHKLYSRLLLRAARSRLARWRHDPLAGRGGAGAR